MTDRSHDDKPPKHALLTDLDADRERILEGLYGALGNHGAQLESLGDLLDALGDALWSAQDASDKVARGEEIARSERARLKRLARLEATLEALLALSRSR